MTGKSTTHQAFTLSKQSIVLVEKVMMMMMMMMMMTRREDHLDSPYPDFKVVKKLPLQSKTKNQNNHWCGITFSFFCGIPGKESFSDDF